MSLRDQDHRRSRGGWIRPKYGCPRSTRAPHTRSAAIARHGWRHDGGALLCLVIRDSPDCSALASTSNERIRASVRQRGLVMTRETAPPITAQRREWLVALMLSRGWTSEPEPAAETIPGQFPPACSAVGVCGSAGWTGNKSVRQDIGSAPSVCSSSFSRAGCPG